MNDEEDTIDLRDIRRDDDLVECLRVDALAGALLCSDHGLSVLMLWAWRQENREDP